MPEEPKAESVANEDATNLDPFWTIVVESVGGEDLRGCHVVQVSRGEYKFTDPGGNSLAESHIFPPIFEDFPYLDHYWTVRTNTGLEEFGEFIIGTWHLVDKEQDSPPESNGEWAGQSGIGGDPLKRAKAASADAS